MPSTASRDAGSPSAADPAGLDPDGARATLQFEWLESTRAQVLLGLTALLLIVGGWVAMDLLAVRSGLLAASDELEAAKASILEADVSAARGHVEAARVEVDGVSGTTSGWVWTLLGAVPVVSDSSQAVDAAVELADASVSLAEAALAADPRLLPSDGTIPLSFEDGRVDLGLLDEYAGLLDGLPLDPVRAARNHLATAADGMIPGVLERAANEAVATADDVLATLEAGEAGLEVVRGMLGTDGPRTILIAIQNPSELRSAGGLVGFLAVLTVDDGRIELAPPIDVQSGALPDDADARGGAEGIAGPGVVFHNDLQTSDKSDPVDRPAEIAERYDHNHIGVELESVTLHPDLPVSAPILRDIYAKYTGIEADSIVLVTPIALQRIQEAVGDVDVPDDLAATAPTLPDPIPADELAQVLLVDTYDALGGISVERRDYQAVLANQSFDTLVRGEWEPTDVVRALGDALAGRHVQMWSDRPAEQERLERLGIAGEMVDLDPNTDDLMITATNSAANKADSFARHLFHVAIELDNPRDDTMTRRMHTRISLMNTFGPDEVHDGFIQDAWFRDGQGGVYRDERSGLMRTWWTWWIDEDEAINRYWVGDPSEPRGWGDEYIDGLNVVDGTVLASRGETVSLGMDYTQDVTVERDGDELIYRWRWRRQPKVVHDELTVRLTPPLGWFVTSATATTGPALPTLDGLDFQAPVTQLEPGAVTMTAKVTGDIVLEVRMTR